MDSKLSNMVPFSCMLLLAVLGLATSEVDKECADELLGLSTCLPYAAGDAIIPSKDCCTALKEALDKNKRCLCIMIRDRNDPSLVLKINTTQAATIPSICHSQPANVSECISLLDLSPSSPEAKDFQGLATINSTSPLINVYGCDGGKAKRRTGVLEMACGISVLIFTLQNIL